MASSFIPLPRALFIGLSLALGLSACASDAETCAPYAERERCMMQLQANREASNAMALMVLGGGMMNYGAAIAAQPAYVAPVHYNAAPVTCWQSGQSLQCY